MLVLPYFTSTELRTTFIGQIEQISSVFFYVYKNDKKNEKRHGLCLFSLEFIR